MTASKSNARLSESTTLPGIAHIYSRAPQFKEKIMKTSTSAVRRCLTAVFVAMLAIAGIVGMAQTSSATTSSCVGRAVIAIGGVGTPDAGVYPDWAVDRKVHYSGNLNDIGGGLQALSATVSDYHNQCGVTAPMTITGHSQGAGIVHLWLQQNHPANTNAVLFSDPKMYPTGESDDPLAWLVLGGSALTGTDSNYGGTPTVSICNQDDVICARGAGWYGYLFTGAHGRYDFNPRQYAGMTGIIWH